MVVFSVLFEKIEDEYYYRYISDSITYYLPSYRTDRLDKPISSFINVQGPMYAESVYKFLDRTFETGEHIEDFTVKDPRSEKEISLTLFGYKYLNFIILVGSQKSDSLLENTLFKENYLFLIQWVSSKESVPEDISDNLAGLLEYTKQEILAKPYISLIHSDDVSSFKSELLTYLDKGTASFYQKYRLVSKSGKDITVLDHTCRILRENVVVTISYLRDITKDELMSSRLAELALLDEENFNTSLLIKIEWDRNFNISRWNQQARELLGWDNSIIGKNIRDISLLNSEDAIAMQGQLKRLLNHEVELVVSNYKICKKDGNHLDTKWSNKLAIRDGDLRVLSSIIDRSEEALLATKLIEMEERSDLLLKTLYSTNTNFNNDVFRKLVDTPLTSSSEGLIKAEIIIRKIEEELKRLNDTIFHNNGNNLLSEVANLKYEVKDLREDVNKVKESQSKLSTELSDLLNINILSLGKNINFKNLVGLLVISYVIFGILFPALYHNIAKPYLIQYNKELKQIEGKKD